MSKTAPICYRNGDIGDLTELHSGHWKEEILYRGNGQVRLKITFSDGTSAYYEVHETPTFNNTGRSS